MAKIEISLPDQTESEIDRLVDAGEFINRDEAIEELLSRGVSVYRNTGDSTSEPASETFDQFGADQDDPAIRDEDGTDEYSF